MSKKNHQDQNEQAGQDQSTASGSPSAPKITPLKKITVAGVYGKVLVKDIPEGEELKICRFAGTANAVVSGESSYGHFEGLVGEFAATNYVTGEIFVGKQAYVPGAMGEALIGGLAQAQYEDASASVRFSVDVSVKVSPRDANKYEYIVRPVIESALGNQAVALLGLEG